VPLPYSRFEIELPRLAPRRTVPLVLLDDGRSGVAVRAARRARSLGYTDVHILAGGTRAWQAAGYTLFKGVNVVSKAFGELAEHAFGTPSISAKELHERVARGDDLIVVDGRPLEEFHKMSIPGATCCPNGELAYRIADIAPDPQTTIVVNCAGRTRSLIGAQTLRQVGVMNRVYALRNGTMGWRLAGYDLDHGRHSRYPEVIQAERRSVLAKQARSLSEQWGVPRIDAAKAHDWLADNGRTTYLLDVRTIEEFAACTAPGAQHAPGGQLVQATDQWLGVRGARVILLDDAAIRATTTAYWLRLMGWDVVVLEGSADDWASLDTAQRQISALPELPLAAVGDLSGAFILDLRLSQVYRAGHIASARWAIRPRLADAIAQLPAGAPLVLAAAEPDVARAFATELPREMHARTSLLTGDVAAWRAAGLDIVATPNDPPDADCIDHLFFVHDRHAGNLKAAQQYLDWETGLVAQLDADERASFWLPHSSS
jgi:rhodanese-related sulfurtransferase